MAKNFDCKASTPQTTVQFGHHYVPFLIMQLVAGLIASGRAKLIGSAKRHRKQVRGVLVDKMVQLCILFTVSNPIQLSARLPSAVGFRKVGR